MKKYFAAVAFLQLILAGVLAHTYALPDLGLVLAIVAIAPLAPLMVVCHQTQERTELKGLESSLFLLEELSRSYSGQASSPANVKRLTELKSSISRAKSSVSAAHNRLYPSNKSFDLSTEST